MALKKHPLAFILLFVTFEQLINGCYGIDVDVIAPSTLAVGSSADLDCRWTLKSDELVYSVKWYQGLREIYRYTPSKYPSSIQRFPNDFLQVDERASENGKVRVTNVTLGADGLFRCEVSQEGPPFYTSYGTVNITVVSPPQDNPTIISNIDKAIYSIGDWVDLRCETSEAKPPPKLTFFVNEQKAPGMWLEPQQTYATHNGLYKSSLRIRFTLGERMLDYKGALKVRCTANSLDVYMRSTNLSLITGRFAASSIYGGRGNTPLLPGPAMLIISSLVTVTNLSPSFTFYH